MRHFLRGDYFWQHERKWEYPLARLICRFFGHVKHPEGDCKRCWG